VVTASLPWEQTRSTISIRPTQRPPRRLPLTNPVCATFVPTKMVCSGSVRAPQATLQPTSLRLRPAQLLLYCSSFVAKYLGEGTEPGASDRKIRCSLFFSNAWWVPRSYDSLHPPLRNKPSETQPSKLLSCTVARSRNRHGTNKCLFGNFSRIDGFVRKTGNPICRILPTVQLLYSPEHREWREVPRLALGRGPIGGPSGTTTGGRFESDLHAQLKTEPRERPCVGVVWRSLQVFQKPFPRGSRKRLIAQDRRVPFPAFPIQLLVELYRKSIDGPAKTPCPKRSAEK
jgi:hypothetical protein